MTTVQIILVLVGAYLAVGAISSAFLYDSLVNSLDELPRNIRDHLSDRAWIVGALIFGALTWPLLLLSGARGGE